MGHKLSVTSEKTEQKPQLLCPTCGQSYAFGTTVCIADGSLLLPPDPFLGTVLSGKYDYEVQSILGRGGMSVVYKARNRQLNSIVAIKSLKAELVADTELFSRFTQEAALVQKLAHPNVISVHEFGIAPNGQPFLVMDFLKGELLADVIEKNGRISVKRFLRIFVQVCDALSHIHSHKIIHRDVKPSNIMLIETAQETDVVRLFDFGFCKQMAKTGVAAQQLTQTGDVLGTPLYMSPEQSRGKTLDTRTDIYSLGCVMYEALTGKAPLVGENVIDTMHKHINEMPVSLDAARPDLYIPDQLTKVLFRALEKDVDKRYQSVNDLKRDLETIQSGGGGKPALRGSLPGLSRLKTLPAKSSVQDQVVLVTLSVIALSIVGYLCFEALVRPVFVTAVAPQTTGTSTRSTDPTIRWSDYHDQAMQAYRNGRYTAAVDLLRLAVTEANKADESQVRTAITLNDLAKVYLAEQKFSDAHKAAGRALSIRQKIGNKRDIAEVLVTIAQIDLARENYKLADSLLQKALSLQEEELGKSHEEVGTTYNLIGHAREQQENYPRAEAAYKQALSIRQTSLGPNNLSVAETLQDYARLLKKMKRPAEADKLLARAQKIETQPKE